MRRSRRCRIIAVKYAVRVICKHSVDVYSCKGPDAIINAQCSLGCQCLLFVGVLAKRITCNYLGILNSIRARRAWVKLTQLALRSFTRLNPVSTTLPTRHRSGRRGGYRVSILRARTDTVRIPYIFSLGLSSTVLVDVLFERALSSEQTLV